MERVLEGSGVWGAFKEQRHDLFLPAGGAGGGSGVAGLLQARRPHLRLSCACPDLRPAPPPPLRLP